MFKRFAFLSSTIYFLCFSCIAAMADYELTFQQNKNGYRGSLGVSIDAENPADSDIGDTNILWDGPFDYLLMKFDQIIGTGPAQIPPNSTIVSAELIYSIANTGDPANVHEMLVTFVNGSWNDQPFLAAGSQSLTLGTHIANSPIATAPGQGTIGSFDITALLQKWVNGGTNNGIAFAPTGTDDVQIINPDRPIQHRPRLVVQTPIGVFTFEDGVNGYNGNVDTWTEIDIPLRDIGRDTRNLGDGGLDDPSWAFERFDNIFGNAPGQIPLGTQILDARIEISIFNVGDFITFHEMKPGFDFNEYTRKEAQTLGVLPTNVATHGNPRTVAGTGQYTIPGIDFVNDATRSEQIIANYYDPEAFLELDLSLSQPLVPEEVIPFEIRPEGSVPRVVFPDPNKQPVMFHPEVVDIIPTGFTGNTSVNVTSTLQKYSNGEPNLGWFLFHEGSFGGPGDGTEFRSSEWSLPEPPTLTIITPNRTYSFIDGKDGYEGVVDTHIDGTLADDAFGDAERLVTNGLVAEFGEISALIRFDDIIGTGANQVPPGTQILSAQLSLVTSEQGGGTRIFDLPSNASFDETTTWNSFVNTVGDPINDFSLNDNIQALQLNPDVGAGAKIDMNVTSSIQRYASGQPNTGWIIVPLVPFLDPGISTGGLGQGDDALLYISSEGGRLLRDPEPALRVVIAGDPPVSSAIHDFMIFE